MIERVRSWIHEADQISILTGAGISTDSGIPDFRGPKGVWTKNPEAEKMATLQHLHGRSRRPQAAWQSRLKSSEIGAKPNLGHAALVELERRGKLHTLITQNVDGLHLERGTRRRNCRDPRHHARGGLHGLRRTRGHGARARPRSQRRRGPRVPKLRRHPQVRHNLVRPGPGRRRPDARPGRRRELRPHARNWNDPSGAPSSPASSPSQSKSGARVVIINADPTEMDSLADAIIRGSISEVLVRLTSAEA